VRRLPGPADCRLCERVQTLEALLVLFRDWQRTPTQSSVRTLRSLRLQMDVRFCTVQEPPAERHCCATEGSDQSQCTPSGARLQTSRFLLTTRLHGCRQYGHFDPVPRKFRVAGKNEAAGAADARLWHTRTVWAYRVRFIGNRCFLLNS
jgi:hypothetical protein